MDIDKFFSTSSEPVLYIFNQQGLGYYIAIPMLVRYKILGLREQGTGNREQGIRNKESVIEKKLKIGVSHKLEKRYN